MYAIVNIAGQQFKVETDRKIFVHRIDAEEGSSVEFNEVLLLEEDGKIIIGKPYIDGASVIAKIVEHLKGDKVLVFKKKRRKGYQKLNGHRQHFTRLEIEGIYKQSQAPKKSSGKKSEKKEQIEADVPTDTPQETTE